MEAAIITLNEPAYIWPILIVTLLPVELILKLIAMWKAAHNNHAGWFIILFVLISAGILPLIYILAFSKPDKGNTVVA